MDLLLTNQRLALQRALVLRPRIQSQQIRTIFAQTQSTFRTRPQRLVQAHRRALQTLPRRPQAPTRLQNIARSSRRYASEDASLDKPDSQLSLSQRLKKLSREYGWAALYIYLGLSALDFPFCFLAVKWIGTDTIGHYEHLIVGTIKEWLAWPLGGDVGAKVSEVVDKVENAVVHGPGQTSATAEGERVLEVDVTDHGYKAAEKANSGDNASLWTQLALAYAIHKSFIFIRVPLTAAVTPKIVKTLRGWGWNIGRPTTKALKGSGKSGVNTKGSKVTDD